MPLFKLKGKKHNNDNSTSNTNGDYSASEKESKDIAVRDTSKSTTMAELPKMEYAQSVILFYCPLNTSLLTPYLFK